MKNSPTLYPTAVLMFLTTYILPTVLNALAKSRTLRGSLPQVLIMCMTVTRAVHVSSVLIITQSFHVRVVTENVDPRVEFSLLWLRNMVKRNKVCLRLPPVKKALAR
jgi:hypothetical protein